MLNQINEGTGQQVLLALGGTAHPGRAASGDRITDATYQEILVQLEAIAAGGSGGGGEDNIHATGTDRATAYQLTKAANRVTSASDGNQAIKIPVDWPMGVPISVYSDNGVSYNGLKIFSGQAGDKINFFGSFDSGFSIPDAWMKIFIRLNNNNWFVIIELSS